MVNFVKQLEDLKEKAQKNKENKIRKEEQLKSLEEQKEKHLEELVPLEVKNEDLEKIIKEDTQLVEQELEKLTGIVNG